MRELLTNVFKHANTPAAKVSLRRTGEGFEIAVEDQGSGFDTREMSDPKDTGFGLLSVREQLRRLGGTLEITSAPTKGTRVNLRLPLQPASSSEVGNMRVLLADDHRMMRDGLRAVLEKDGIEVVGEAANGREAMAQALALAPDVVVMDIAMPELNGIDAARRIAAELPRTKVLALSMSADRRYVMAMLEAGASGYLLKNAASDELLRALEAVMRGETYLSPSIAGDVVGRAIVQGSPSSLRAEKQLTPRERQVLQLLAEGKSSKEIAAALQIALPTVETHRRQLTAKLNLRTIAELTKYAIREGITSVEP